jgi:beta-lactam-binding protein with PASTA domain
VPKLLGTTVRAARHSIESHTCSVGAIDYARSGTVRARHVISQTPAPGKHRAPGTDVNLTVSRG